MQLLKIGTLTSAIVTTAITVIIIVGNILVILSVLIHPPLRHVQNSLLVSLALADLAVGMFVVPLNIVTIVFRGQWIFGQTWCTIHVASDIFFSTASIMNLCIIALDRYLVIRHSTNYLPRRTLTNFLAMISLAYLLSAVIVIPPLMGWASPIYLSCENRNHTEISCLMNNEIGYVIYSAMGSFFIPAGLILFVYFKLFRLIRSRSKVYRKSALSCVTRLNFTPEPVSSNCVQGASAIPVPSWCHEANSHSEFIIHSKPNEIKNGIQKAAKVPEVSLPNVNAVQKRTKLNGISSLDRPFEVNKDCQPSEHQLASAKFIQGNSLIPSGSKVTLRFVPNCDKLRGRPKQLERSTISDPSPCHILDEPDTNFQMSFYKFRSDCSTHRPRWTLIHGIFRRQSENCILKSVPTSCDFTHPSRKVNTFLPKNRFSRTVLRSVSCRLSGYDDEKMRDKLPPMVRPTSLGSAAELRQQISMSHERKAARTLFIILGTFILCWLPFFIMYLLAALCREYCPLDWNVQQFITWLGYANSGLNPIIYTTFNNDFQVALRKLLHCK